MASVTGVFVIGGRRTEISDFGFRISDFGFETRGARSIEYVERAAARRRLSNPKSEIPNPK